MRELKSLVDFKPPRQDIDLKTMEVMADDIPFKIDYTIGQPRQKSIGSHKHTDLTTGSTSRDSSSRHPSGKDTRGRGFSDGYGKIR